MKRRIVRRRNVRLRVMALLGAFLVAAWSYKGDIQRKDLSVNDLKSSAEWTQAGISSKANPTTVDVGEVDAK